MAQWGNIDRANNAPLFAAAQVKKTANAANQAALFNNVTADAYITGLTVGTVGVSPAELAAAQGGVDTITVTAAGGQYTVRPTVTITTAGDSGSGATATATAKVVGVISIIDGGQDYAVNDVLTINTTGAAGTTATANLNVLTVNATGGILTVSVNTAGSFTTLPTNQANNALIGGNGTGALANVSFGVGAVTVTAAGTGYRSAPVVTFGGAGGTGTTATATLLSEQSSVPSPGWNLRTVFANGHVRYETLVAMKTITSDATADDDYLPD